MDAVVLFRDCGCLLRDKLAEVIDLVKSVNRPPWDYKKLAEKADVIVIATLEESIIRPRADQRGDAFVGEHRPDFDTDNFISLDSRFTVRGVLKGKVAEEHISVAHLKWKPKVIIMSDIRLITFQKQIRIPLLVAVAIERKITDLHSTNADIELVTPEYLLFLRRRGDGLYELASGHKYAADSVRIVNVGARSELADGD